MPDTDVRPLRLCEACGGLDDHPRHVQTVADVAPSVPEDAFFDGLPDGTPAHAIRLALTPGQVMRHVDCCAAAGCVQCQATEAATDGVRGLPLFDALADLRANGFEEPTITTNEELGHHG